MLSRAEFLGLDRFDNLLGAAGPLVEDLEVWITGAGDTMITLSYSSLLCRRWPFDKGDLDSISPMDETRLSIISIPTPGPTLPMRLDFLLISSRYSCRIAMPWVCENKEANNAGCKTDAPVAANAITDRELSAQATATTGAAGEAGAAALGRQLSPAAVVVGGGELWQLVWCGCAGGCAAKRSFRERVECAANPISSFRGPSVFAFPPRMVI